MFIDSHCHINFSQFDGDRGAVLEQCSQLGIHKIIVPGTHLEFFEQQIHLAKTFPELRNAFGIHPYFLETYDDTHLNKLAFLLEDKIGSVVALGEIGLDKVISIDWKIQLKVFQAQVEMAKNFKLPIILHQRKSHNEILQILKQCKFNYGGIVHGFSGSLQVANAYIDLGFAIGIGGTITYPRANKTREAIKSLPLSSIVLETDAPDMPLRGNQGVRNSPINIPVIFEALSTLRNEPTQQLQKACFKNVENHLIHV
ncbi:MAG: TatD family hydrolase [Paraglaciecola sp.]|uniref:TatD family hydrolase n=1 Tax=Paraglaciecola sp. TaxID=1920173 RepID=UPI00329A3B84